MQIKRTVRTFLAAAALTGAALIAAPAPQAHAAVFVSVGIAPPAIPVYEQPLCPGDGYIWTPGYWAWGPDGYYWVDGAWVLPPYEEALWTPGWWGWGDGLYYWHPGYWGRTVGYYGGINYGFGYFGTGFYGGYWNGGHFFYNRAYNHFGGNFHGNVYERTYAGFSGRPGGASFVSHPPAQFSAASHGAEAFHGSAINGTPHGTEAFPNRGANGFSNRNNEGSANRGNDGFVNRRQGFTDRGAVNNDNRPAQSFGGSQPNYSRGGQNYENRGAQNYGQYNRGAEPSYNRGAEPNYNRGSQPSYNRAPAAPSGNVNRGGSAPAPQYSAPSGGGGSRGGGGGGNSRGGGGGHR